MAKDLKRFFIHAKIYEGLIKLIPHYLSLEKMQIKTARRYHHKRDIRMATIKRIICWRGYGATGTLILCW